LRPLDAPALDVSAIESAFDAHASDLRPEDRALAARTLDRVRPPNWTLEWYLPMWLGHAFGVPGETSLQIASSNVLGLVAVRLEDDALDGEIAGEELEAARRVSAALLAAAIGAYRPLFGPGSPFWAELDATLSTWRSSPTRSLAARGAPLKVGARAICLLADRAAAWPMVDACLDNALTALALYDDVCDWEADLAAGRWNAFVASVTDRPQDAPNRWRNRSAVLVALMTGTAASDGFGRVAAEADRAAALARSLGSAALAAHLATVGARAAAQGSAVESHYVGAVDRATTLIFGATVSGGTG
jgi:hypothetical protein